MNQENNNFNNQQPMNNQPMNNQPMNNQGYNQQPMNNQPMMDNQQMNQQPMGQPINQQPMNNQGYNQQPPMGQPMNNQGYNQQPMGQPYQNYNGNQFSNPPKKDNKMLFIILGVVALIVVAVVVLIIVLNNNNSKGNTINDYENGGVVDNGNTGNNNNTQQEVNNNNNNEDDENSIAYKGFSIPKQLGYEYEIDATSGLLIGNNSFATMVEVTYGTLESVKSVKDQLVAEYTNLGMNPTNVNVSTYGGKEALTMEITMQGQKALFYVIDAGSDYSFLGLAMNPSFTIDYNDIQTSVSLLSKAKYTGVYRVNTDDINVIEFKNLFE